MKLDPALRDEFMAAARAADRSAAQVLRDFMREFVRKRQREAGGVSMPPEPVKLGSALSAFGREFGGLDLDIWRDKTPGEPVTFD
jgi:hypothetical protein